MGTHSNDKDAYFDTLMRKQGSTASAHYVLCLVCCQWALPDKKSPPPIEEVGIPDFLGSFKD